jgi:hypothetical protein
MVHGCINTNKFKKDLTWGNKHTYNTAASSVGLLSTSNPPSFHSPEDEINIDVERTFPCVDPHESFTNAKAIYQPTGQKELQSAKT